MATYISVLALFLSGFLIWTVQPMIGKQILPRLGGDPASWNLLVIVINAFHIGGALVGAGLIFVSRRRQIQGLAVLWLLATAMLMFGYPSYETGNFLPWLVAGAFACAIGCMTTTTVLLCYWSWKQNVSPSARIIALIAAAYLLGALAGDFGYPLLIEPFFRLFEQNLAWVCAFGLVGVCVFVTVVLNRRDNAQ